MMIDALYNYRQGDIHSAEFSDEFNALCIPFEESLIEAQLKLRVYAPEGSSGSALLRVSAIIADALERADSDGLLREVSLSGIGYDESAHSEYRDISARLQMLLSKGASA